MGATVTTGKCAAAFHSSNGELLYILFERSYEKNCYPHTDHWSAFAFGTREEVLRRAFAGASDCCGGSLQGRNGEIKPENYIESWKQELNHPVQMRDVSVELKFEQSSRAALPEGSKERVRAALERAGLAERFETIVGDGVTVSLYADTALLRALFGAKGELSPWRVFDRGDAGTVAFSVPAVRNVPIKDAEFPSIRCFAIDSNVRLVADERGAWLHGEWAYSALARFVMDTALERELVQPGYAKATIPFVREALNKALPLPPETRITIRRAACKEDYQQRSVDDIAQGLGLIRDDEQAPDEFSFAFEDIKGEDADRVRYRVGSMRDVITWVVPDVQEAQAEATRDLQGELAFG